MRTLVAIAPSDLPSLPLTERKALPDTAAIYVVMAGDTVLYIGQSVSLRQRWVAHHRLAQLNEHGGCRIAWMVVDDASLLGELEEACIAHFEPVLNREHVPQDVLTRHDVRVVVSLPPEIARWLKDQAEGDLTTMSALIRQLILRDKRQAEGQDDE